MRIVVGELELKVSAVGFGRNSIGCNKTNKVVIGEVLLGAQNNKHSHGKLDNANKVKTQFRLRIRPTWSEVCIKEQIETKIDY